MCVMMVGTQRVDGGSVVNSPKSYGITKPLSLAGPSPADFKRNLELEKVIIIIIISLLLCATFSKLNPD